MQEYTSKKKSRFADISGTSFPSAAKEENIPNSVYNDVFAGKKRASAEMMGHRQDLAPSLAAKMSKAFGMDLSQMQVYRSGAMQGTGMKGMASGNKIVLSRDIDLNTTAGQEVLGHEISHVHAQSQGIGMGHSGLYRNAALEHQADAEGMMAARGQSILGESTGMDMGMGMGGIGGLSPLGPGMSASAGAPMQASLKNKKPQQTDETYEGKACDENKADDEKAEAEREQWRKEREQLEKQQRKQQQKQTTWNSLQADAEAEAWLLHGGKAEDGAEQKYSTELFNPEKVNKDKIKKYGNSGETYKKMVELLYNSSRTKADYDARHDDTKNLMHWKEGSVYALEDEFMKDKEYKDPLDYETWKSNNNNNHKALGYKLNRIIDNHKKKKN